MSSITVKFSRLYQKFTIEENNLSPNYGDIFIGVDIPEERGTAVFNNLSFGYTLYKGSEVVSTRSWPDPGVRYIQTDQDFLENNRAEWKPDWNLKLDVWLEEAGVRHEASQSFKTPRPPQPYPSWIWNGERWVAPVPYPTDGKEYTWDENKKKWVPVSQG